MQSDGVSAQEVHPPTAAEAYDLPPNAILATTVTEPWTPAPPPAPELRARPVQPGERVAGVDVLRGVALMGILAMNIAMFAWPDPVYESPRAGGNTSTLDLVVWTVNHVVFDEKMMTIFSMLFGAGLVLMTGRSDARGASLLGVYYRRVSWLLLFGLLHAYFLWHGDILVLYAQCGFLLYLFRRMAPRKLLALGTVCVLVPVVFAAMVSIVAHMLEENYWGIQGAPRVVLSRVNDFLHRSGAHEAGSTPGEFAKAIETYRGTYPGIFMIRLPFLFVEQTIGFVLVTLWMVGGRMLIGMGLMKLDVFSGRLPRALYWRMVAFGYGLGLPAVAYDCWLRISNNFEGAEMIEAKWVFGYLSALAIAMGHVGVVMLVFQSGAVPWLTRRLAAAGRMALSNYLMQSLICTTIFYGYGFGLFGRLNRLELVGVVVAVWAWQLATSIVWLHFFRYGPAEWLWRSLTYLKPQPILAIAAVSSGLTFEPAAAAPGDEPASAGDAAAEPVARFTTAADAPPPATAE